MTTPEASSDPRLRGIPPGNSISKDPKQAIVVIHGIGEQIPMDTLRAFVKGVWETDTSLTRPRGKDGVDPQEIWSRPDDRTGSLELRRITTRETKPTQTFRRGVRSEFYELYWADLSAGSRWKDIQSWIWTLLFRNPFQRVPDDVFLAWALLWVVSAVVVTLLVGLVLPHEEGVFLSGLWNYPPLSRIAGLSHWTLAFIAFFLSAATSYVIIPYVGRVVRYTRATPENVTARQHIRERGLALLDQLHRAEYERIIVVGHSLGSILAYDLISYFWAMRKPARTVSQGSEEFGALKEAEAAARTLERTPGDEGARDLFLAAQRKLCRALRLRGAPRGDAPDRRWLITDLVTIGSPLGHAEFLLASSKEDFKKRQDAREFPINPPFRERLDPRNVARAQMAEMPLESEKPQLFSFPFNQDNSWQMHHAAPFAAVRWTNIHDPALFVFLGDIVSSPAAPTFGPGVVDINLRKKRGQAERFSHLLYWTERDPVARQHLREALDLAGERELI